MGIRHFDIQLKTIGPVHIGCGEELGKKDYFLIGDKIAVLSTAKFIQHLSSGQLDEYSKFLHEDSRKGLQEFLLRDKSLMSAAEQSVLYRTNSQLSRSRSGSFQYFNVQKCIKDAYDCPYIPGSSIKGMLRTALLTNLILDNRKDYQQYYDSACVRNARDRKHAAAGLEKHAFGTIDDSIMRYVSISDSKPLSAYDLVFAKKFDKFSELDDGSHKKDLGKISNQDYYSGNELNIYRECIKPGTLIECKMEIDERINDCLALYKLDSDGLSRIFERSYALYSDCFLSKFDQGGAEEDVSASSSNDDGICRYVIQSGPFAGRRCKNHAINGTGYCNTHQEAVVNENSGSLQSKSTTCYLGGGVDYVSKTVIYALFEDRLDSVNEAARILDSQFPTRLDPQKHGSLKREVRESGFEIKPMKAQYRSGRLKKAKDDHRHWRDLEFDVSPHAMKFGIIGNEKYPMGKCSICFKERQ